MNTFLQVGVFVVMLGLVPGLMVLLNVRDRRHASLRRVMAACTPRGLRDRIAVQIRCAIFSRGAVVRVHMWRLSRDEVWEAIVRWARELPPDVRLIVNVTVDGDVPATFTVETTRPYDFWRPRGARVPTG